MACLCETPTLHGTSWEIDPLLPLKHGKPDDWPGTGSLNIRENSFVLIADLH